MNLLPVFHPGRCASTFLEKVLSELGFLHFGEICMPGNPWVDMLPNSSWSSFTSISDFITYIFCHASLSVRFDPSIAARSANNAFLEIKLNNYGLSPFGDLEAVARHCNVQGCVFLYSQNYLRRLCSVYRALQHNQWHVEKDDMTYKPKLISIDWNSINDPDIFRVIGKSLPDAYNIYKNVMTTQSEIVRQVCASRNIPFISLSFEALTDSAQLPYLLDSLLKDLRIEGPALPAIEDIRQSIDRVTLAKTGPSDLLSGLSTECVSSFHQIEGHESYLPGGSMDLDIKSWY
jgi:hypothetical protein